MAPGWMQLLLVAVVVLLLFGGRGKISAIMGDMAKGIKSFRTGLKDDEKDDKKPEPINVTPEAEKDKAS